MPTTISIFRPGLKTTLAEALFNEVLSNVNTYYYFVGRTQPWPDPIEQEDIDFNIDPLDIQPTSVFEHTAREDMIFTKKITAADVALTIKRYDWEPDIVFDMYDDRVGQTIEYEGFAAIGTTLFTGEFDLSLFGEGWTVEGEGIPIDTKVVRATPTSIILSNTVTQDVTHIKIILLSSTGARLLEESRFYCITAQKNVYKCLFNNGGIPSTSPPYATTHLPITTDDGYVWKFMYTIPGALNNKFATLEQVPVTTAIRQQYYSRGAIISVIIDDYGRNYTPGDEITVIGDGHATGNVFRIVGVSVLDEGAGYSSPPTVTAVRPFDSIPYEAEQILFTGQYIQHNDLIYEVSQGGITGATPPTHTNTDEAIPNGTTSLRFVGLPINGTATLQNGSVSEILSTGIIGFVKLSSLGSGYDPETPPSVAITGDGEGATAVAYVNGAGFISAIVITNRGTGYTSADVIIDPPPTGGTQAIGSVEIYYGFGYSFIPNVIASPPFTATYQWSENIIVAENDIIQAQERFYLVTSTGGGQTMGDFVPTHFSGTEQNGEVDLQFIGQTAILAPFVQRTRASIVPIIENGQITNVIIQDPGVNYTAADFEITSATGGEGAIIRANLSIGDVNTKQANSELLAIPGTIDFIPVMHPGNNYIFANVIVEGDGTGCVAEPVIQEGRIVAINVISKGVNYTKATVHINGNEDATQAYARAIISPLRGHGRNAIQELYAQNITMTSSLTRERNQGFIVDNDYRQFGILKNPLRFNSIERFTRPSGSTCFSVSGNFLYEALERDMIIMGREGARYRVITFPPEAPVGEVGILLQSLDGVDPIIGDVFSYGEGVPTARLSAVLPPAIDKYSGEVLFLDNRNPYSPTDEQTIAFRTIIQL